MSGVAARVQERLMTGEELARTPGLGPCELIDGRIVPLSPRGGEHGRVESNVVEALKAFVRPRRLGQVLAGEVGIYTRRNPDRVRGADVVFISSNQVLRWSNPSGFLDVAPELIVEILSPDDTVMDLAEKLREYFAISVKLVWVPDPRACRVYVFRSPTDLRELQETDSLPGDDVLPGLDLRVATLFEE